MAQNEKPFSVLSSDGLGAWLPIATAPRDGELVQLYRPTASTWGKVTPGKWNGDHYAKRPRPFWEIWLKIGGLRESREWTPTHWMPLPAPPLSA